MVLKAEGEEPDIRKYVQEKATIREAIDTLEKEIEQLKATKKNTEKHIEFSKLPEDKKFQDLKKSAKQFVDTIKMIAYRAETAMANTLQEYISKYMNELDIHAPKLYNDVCHIIEGTRGRLATTVNAEVCLMHWHIGKRIKEDVLYSQRAEYGKKILKKLQKALTNFLQIKTF